MDILNADVKELGRRQSLCFECETWDCCYNGDGICHFAFVGGDKPKITEEDGCKDYVPRVDW